MVHTSSPGILVFGADATVCHVDSAATALLDADRAALIDGTADVLHDPVWSEDGSYDSLAAFVEALPTAETGPVPVTLSTGRRAEARVTHGADGPAGVVLLVREAPENARKREPDPDSPPSDDQQRRLLKAAVEHTSLPVLVTEAESLDAPGPRITYANPAFTEVTGYTLEEVRGQSPRILQGRQTSRETLDRIRTALEANTPVRETVLNYRKNGVPYWNDLYIAPVEAADGTVTHYVSIQDDVTDRRRAARLRDEQVRLLERIATGTPLADVLADLTSFIEAERPGLLGSVLLLDPEEKTLHHGAAPSLPGGYVEAIDGLRIGPRAGSCGAAVFHDEPIIAEDISTDERWAKCRSLALDHDLQACWSTPIHGESGEVLGTFALYYDAPRRPTEADRLLVEEASHIAGVAIEHDRQKQALRLQEEQFQRLVENAQPIIFLLDAEGTFLLSEGEDLSAVGLEPGELVGTSIYDRYSDYPDLLHHIDRALEGETVDVTVEVEGVVFDIWYAPYYDRSETVAGCIGMAVDITERREAETALRAHRDLLRRTQEMAQVGGWVYDPDTDTMEGTEETYRLYELPPEADVSLEDTLAFYPEETASSLRKAAVRCLQDGIPFDLEGPMTTPKGTERWIRVLGEARRDEEGTITKMVGTVQDLTDRRDMEKRLRSSEARFRGLFEEAALGIALVDSDGAIVEANPEFASMLDTTQAGLRGRSFSSLVASSPEGAEVLPLDDLVTGARDRYEGEHRFVRDDAPPFWGHVTVSPHTGPGDAGVIVMVEDVSSRKAYEEQLKAAKQEAEEASRLKSALLANMSHEIRTPLTSIIGFAGVLSENLSGANARYARLAHQSGQRLMDTLDSVLRLSKLEAGIVNPEVEPMDLVTEVRCTLDLYRPQATSNEIDLRFDASVESLPLQGAPTAVQRILSNLLNNAFKFTPAGGAVTVRVYRTDSAAVLEVEDTGVGIDDDFQSRVFDAFVQESQGLKREHEGSGLGLAIVHRLTDLLGGTIELESTKGEGTLIRVHFPLDD